MKENHSNSVNGTASVNIDSSASPTSTLSSLCEDADSGIYFSIILYAWYLLIKDIVLSMEESSIVILIREVW